MDYRPAATLLGYNVTNLCEKKGLTLKGLVARLGWSAETLQNLESGELDITLDELDRLCVALDTAPQDLLENQA
ncbi:helix-turn-helix transcriptional regulator [Devosia sp.]|uniref:helix-turn-helix domain-containing protein n=1 Tax=Devosia sp. TaxID=1871048 RepID=UPI001ACDCD4B|nr:helix-turn-helix transcriptional regulator [Devosia sp.]MBN9332774.1 helix-turn-helix transcriptional regulator [Devosia sp.]